MSLLDYIPTPDEINKCIRNEAEGAHEAILLSVHQPSPLSYRIARGARTAENKSVSTNEQELFDFVLTPNIPTGALVVPITGASGVGKSHLIRIIDARLRASVEARRHLIIRIPKSASLRRVVELILGPLPNSTYAEVKRAFKTALAAVDVDTAAIRFHAEIEIALKEHAAELAIAARANPTQILKEQLDHSRRLPLLLADPITAPHFRQSVFPRIIQRAVSGTDVEEVDATRGQFFASDLELPGSTDLGRAAQPVAMYYRTAIQAHEGRGREVAASVLNSVVDQATRQLFSLQSSLGGMTLEEVVLEIRRLLLKENRELILLVEDFAALTGIQDTLAKVLIHEGVRDGVTQFATMRSVIAVTDGYLVGRDTLATRAMREWIIESKISSDEEVLTRARRLVAAYLNAARWGEEELVRRYAGAGSIASNDGHWVSPFVAPPDDDADRLIAGFGYEAEIPLFPFTRAAIEYLVRASLTQGGELIFNPRFIINEVLRRVLLPARAAFENDVFPPASVDSTRPSAEIAQWLATLHVSSDVRDRYRLTTMVWGNNPQERADVGRIPREVFEAFGLGVPDVGPAIAPPPKPKGPKEAHEPPQPLPTSSPEVDRLRATLELWVQGTQLPQIVASRIRSNLAAALNEQIDWNAERCLKIEITPPEISIPQAAGEGRVAGSNIPLAPDHSDPDGRVRAEVMALLRLRQFNAGRTDYPEYEVDRARISNLVDRLMPQALRIVRERNIRQTQMAILALSTNSRGLGLAKRAQTLKGIHAFLFGRIAELELLPDEAPTPLKEWKTLQVQMVQVRPRLTTVLQATAGCFQGTGDTPSGIDITRIVDNYPDSDMRLELASLERLTVDERQLLTPMSESRLAVRLGGVAKEHLRLRDVVTRKLGNDFDKNVIAASALELADEMGRGVWDSNAIGVTLPEFRRLCEDFRACALKEALDSQVPRVSTGQVDGESIDISTIASLNFRPLLVAERFSRLCEIVVTAAITHASTLEDQYGGVSAAETADAILNLFDVIDTQIKELGR